MTEPPHLHPLRRLQHWGVILWPSFVAAGLASVVFFAFIDPVQLGRISFPARPLSREFGYTVGFFMFWAVTAASSAITWYLLRPIADSNDDVPLG